MCGVLVLSEHTYMQFRCIIKTVGLMSNFEQVKYSSLLNTLKGNCFDDKQYM